MNTKSARLLRSAITAPRKGGMHEVAMIYGNGHDSLWLKAYLWSRKTSERARRHV